MILRCSIVTPADPTAPCNGVLNTVALAGLTYTVVNNGNTLPMGAGTLTLVDGTEVGCTLAAVGQVVNLTVNTLNVWDSFLVTINVSCAGYNSYSNVYTIFGYDLGNDPLVVPAVTLNSDFNIVLISTATVLPYSSVTAYRSPFTNKVLYYKNNSGNFNTVEITDTVLATSIIDSTVSNGQLCSSDTLHLISTTTLYNPVTLVTNSCTLSTPVVVNAFTWIPTFEITSACVDCADSCVTILNNNQATIIIDWDSIDMLYINDVQSYPITSLDTSYSLIDNTGLELATEHYTYNGIEPTLTVGTVNHSFSSYILPTHGSYIIQGCIYILGTLPLVLESGDTIATQYYRVSNTLNAANFTMCSAPVNAGTLADVFLAISATPTWSTKGQLLQVDVTGSPTANKWYKMMDIQAATDFTNICNPSLIAAAIDSTCYFYSDGTAPTLWGAAAAPAYAPAFIGGSISEALAVITCCKNIVVEGCELYEIERTDCSTFTVYNRDVNVITVGVSQLINGVWTLLATENVDPFSNTIITLTEDAVYYFLIQDIDGNQVFFTKFVYCGIETCKLNYLKKIICCNPEGNCSDCVDDDCKHKNYYDFNAFSILMATYYAMLNAEINFNYSYSASEINDVTKIAELYSLEQLIERANEYCQTCNTPCTDC